MKIEKGTKVLLADIDGGEPHQAFVIEQSDDFKTTLIGNGLVVGTDDGAFQKEVSTILLTVID